MDTLRSFKRCGAKGGYRQMSYQGITTLNVLPSCDWLHEEYSYPRKEVGLYKWETYKMQKQKRMIEGKIKIKQQFLYFVPAHVSIRQQLIPIYNTTVHKNKIILYEIWWKWVKCGKTHHLCLLLQGEHFHKL